jgi:hypothetical protein
MYVEVTASAAHPIRALIEEVIRAIAVAEVVRLPWFIPLAQGTSVTATHFLFETNTTAETLPTLSCSVARARSQVAVNLQIDLLLGGQSVRRRRPSSAV